MTDLLPGMILATVAFATSDVRTELTELFARQRNGFFSFDLTFIPSVLQCPITASDTTDFKTGHTTLYDLLPFKQIMRMDRSFVSFD